MKQQTRQAGSGAWTLAAALVLTAAAAAAAARAQLCGDLDGDGDVDAVDLRGYVLYDFGCTGGDCIGDVDGDGDTDQQDLAWLITFFMCGSNYGPCEPIGTGTLDIGLVQVDNTSIGPGDDDYAPGFDGGVTHFAFDLVVAVTADNDWTTQWSYLELMHPEVEFFNHAFGSDTEPNSALFGAFPALKFDSFYADPPELLGWGPGFALDPHWTDASVEAIWWDTLHDEDYAAATTQRFTLIVPEGTVPTVLPDDCAHDFVLLAQISTDVTAASTGSDLLHAEFLIVDLAQPTCPGDVDGDGDVDQSDLGVLLTTYERSPDDPLYDERADVNCDGAVDQSDLGILLAVYGADC